MCFHAALVRVQLQSLCTPVAAVGRPTPCLLTHALRAQACPGPHTRAQSTEHAPVLVLGVLVVALKELCVDVLEVAKAPDRVSEVDHLVQLDGAAATVHVRGDDHVKEALELGPLLVNLLQVLLSDKGRAALAVAQVV